MDRRTFNKIMSVGAAGTVLSGAASSMTPAGGRPLPRHPRADRHEFGPVKQIRTGDLDTGYVELGPTHGEPIILLHGWPYDIHSYVDVAPILAAEGYRVIVPYFRGHGTTRFRSTSTPRNAQQTVFALDIIALMDALSIKRATLGGYDWGSRTGDIIAALWPERVTSLVSVTGYLITNLAKNREPLSATSEWAWWYQYYFATERGRLGLELRPNRHDLARLVWSFNSPTWRFDDATFNRTARAFDNPDYVDIVIFNYRWRLGLVASDARYDAIESRLQATPSIAVPTVTIDGAKDPFTPAGEGATYRSHFVGPYEHRTYHDIGHNVPQEAPERFAHAVIDSRRL